MSNTKPNASEGELLRFITAGSVDDGKSTLIGRLLYDSKSLLEDQIEAVTEGETINLANLTDGLRAEREQGITIDVAYRYFNTEKRKFIIADSPGHIQYTRNMVTAASTANLAIIIIDARHGVIEQTRRHSYLASLLRVPHFVICVNKMDLVDYSEEVFNTIKKDYSDFASRLSTKDISYIPISALEGDNVTSKSEKMSWYSGSPLLEYLEGVHIASDRNLQDSRFPVQWVNRPNQDFRAYAGQVSGGVFKKGDTVVALPSGLESKIKGIHNYEGELETAWAPMSVNIELEDELDISRGDFLVSKKSIPNLGKEVRGRICWMSQTKLHKGKKLLLKTSSRQTQAMVSSLDTLIDIESLNESENPEAFELNDIGIISMKTALPVVYDSYLRNRYTGSFILVDPQSNNTVASGMFLQPSTELPKPEYTDYAI